VKNLIRAILLIILLFGFYHLFGDNNRIFDNIAYFTLDGFYSIVLLVFILPLAVVKIHRRIIYVAIGYHILKIVLNGLCYFLPGNYFELVNKISFSVVIIVMLLLIISIFYKK
jgi:hypothetical protein